MPAAPTPEQTTQAPAAQNDDESKGQEQEGEEEQLLDHNGKPITDKAAYIKSMQDNLARQIAKNGELSAQLGELKTTVDTTEVDQIKSAGDIAALEERLNAKIEEERTKRRAIVSQVEERLRESAIASAIASAGVASGSKVEAMLRATLMGVDGVTFDPETMALAGSDRYRMEVEELVRELGLVKQEPDPAPVQRTTGSAIVGQPGEAPPAQKRPRTMEEIRRRMAAKHFGS